MTVKKLTNFFAVLLVAVVLLLLHRYAYGAASLEEQKRALDIINDFAEHMCKNIPLSGSENNLDLTGDGKLELNKLISKLASLKIEAAAKYKDEKYQGVLQKDLVEALKKSTDCKLEIWRDLKDKLIPKLDASLSKPPAVGEQGRVYHLESIATAAAANRSDCHGEDYPCGQGCVQCAEARIKLPRDAIITEAEIWVKNSGDNWTQAAKGENCNTVIGWCSVESAGMDGEYYYARLKNWKHDLSRDIKLKVSYQLDK